MRQSRTGVLILTIGLGLCGSGMWPLAAEPSSEPAPAPQKEFTGPPTQPDDISALVQELANVRDYTRLYWILDAIEHQAPPVRAELLQQLDERIQALFQAEVETRTAAATANLQAVLERSRLAAPVNPSAANASSQPRAYDEVEQEIAQTTFDADPNAMRAQMINLSRMIAGVKDANQQRELMTRMQQRHTEALKAQLEAKGAAKSKAARQPDAAETPSMDHAPELSPETEPSELP